MQNLLHKTNVEKLMHETNVQLNTKSITKD